MAWTKAIQPCSRFPSANLTVVIANIRLRFCCVEAPFLWGVLGKHIGIIGYLVHPYSCGPVVMLFLDPVYPRLINKAASIGKNIELAADKVSEVNSEGIADGFTLKHLAMQYQGPLYPV